MKITRYDVGWMAGLLMSLLSFIGAVFDASKPVQFLLMLIGGAVLVAGNKIAKGMKE